MNSVTIQNRMVKVVEDFKIIRHFHKHILFISILVLDYVIIIIYLKCLQTFLGCVPIEFLS